MTTVTMKLRLVVLVCLLAAQSLPGIEGRNLSVQAAEPGTMIVRVLLYSGRPDPEYVLDQQRDSELITRVYEYLNGATEAPSPASGTVIPSILGYKGIHIRNPERLGGLPPQFAIYRGNVEVRDEEISFAADPERRLETVLLNTALRKGLLGAELLEAEKISLMELE